uniref:BHLH domain-containing protein n=1 Tax=Kalanchoe fedtschenkoi TaxID=63787 RepID=A0A7N1A9W9_KALFE
MRVDDEASTNPVVADCDIGYVDASHQQQQRVMIEDDEVDRLMSVEIESQFHNEHELAVDIPQISMDLFAFDDDAVDYGLRGDHVNGFSGDSLACIVDDFDVGDGLDDEDDNDGNASSGTTTTTATPKKGKADRSKTIVSERRRRGRMKDNLYALRSLVPNITKMDKASIVGDAVLYVQNLQVTAERLKLDIAELEASTAGLGLNATNPSLTSNNNNNDGRCSTTPAAAPPPRYIKQMDVFHVGGRDFYAKLVSNQGVQIAACLHKAIESLRNGLSVRSSNLSTVVDHYVLTFTLHVREGGEGEIKLPNLKMCLSRALAGQGFILKSSPSV